MVGTNQSGPHLAGGRHGRPLCSTISKATLFYSREGGLGALAPDRALCFLQPRRLPAGRVPFLSPSCLWRPELLLWWLALGQPQFPSHCPRATRPRNRQQ